MKPKKSVEKFMTSYPSVANPKMKALMALKHMQKGRFRHLPVVDNYEIVGVVSERDLLRLETLLEAVDPPLEEVMIRNPYVVTVGTSLAEVAKVMATEKYGCTVVVNDKKSIVGIFTTTDGMRLLSRLLEPNSNDGDEKDFGESAIEEYFEWTSRSECLD